MQSGTFCWIFTVLGVLCQAELGNGAEANLSGKDR